MFEDIRPCRGYQVEGDRGDAPLDEADDGVVRAHHGEAESERERAGDGGITVMGANIINMGVVGGFIGYYGYTAIKRVIGNAYAAAFIAAWAALFISAILCAVELAIAGTFPLVPALTGLGLYHAVIGLIEGGITAGALYLIASARPDILEHPAGVSV